MTNSETVAIQAGYKQTEVGVIPEDWSVLALTALCSLKSGETITAASFEDGAIYPCYGGNGLRGYTKTFNHDGEYALIGRQGALCGNVQYVNDKFFASEHALVATPSKITDVKWLAIYLEQMNLNQYSESSAQPGLSAIKLSVLKLIAPNKKEQTAIANALSDVDKLIAALETLIAKKSAIKTAAMQQLLTGKKRLPAFVGEREGQHLKANEQCTAKPNEQHRTQPNNASDTPSQHHSDAENNHHQHTPRPGYKHTELGEIPEDWEVRSIFQIAGGKKSQFDDGDWVEAEHITNEGVRLIQTGNIGIGRYVEKDNKKYINEKSFEELRCKELIKGDLLICRLAEPAGRACIFPGLSDDKVITSVDVTVFRPDETEFNRKYLEQFLSTKEWFKTVLEFVGGTTHKRISRGSLGRISIILPSFKEQTAIANVLSDMDAELDALQQRLAKTQTIKQGMMQELLTGKTRLINYKEVKV